MKKFLSLITVACLSMISAMAAVVTPVTDLEQAVADGTVLLLALETSISMVLMNKIVLWAMLMLQCLQAMVV